MPKILNLGNFWLNSNSGFFYQEAKNVPIQNLKIMNATLQSAMKIGAGLKAICLTRVGTDTETFFGVLVTAYVKIPESLVRKLRATSIFINSQRILRPLMLLYYAAYITYFVFCFFVLL